MVQSDVKFNHTLVVRHFAQRDAGKPSSMVEEPNKYSFFLKRKQCLVWEPMPDSGPTAFQTGLRTDHQGLPFVNPFFVTEPSNIDAFC
jgi:hypothetical protein